MAVGTTPRACYQSEDVRWSWVFTDATGNITSISGFTFSGVIKETAAALNPPLLTFNCAVISATAPMTYGIASGGLQVVLAPGSYNISVRRTDVPFRWQTVDEALTVLDSASVD